MHLEYCSYSTRAEKSLLVLHWLPTQVGHLHWPPNQIISGIVSSAKNWWRKNLLAGGWYNLSLIPGYAHAQKGNFWGNFFTWLKEWCMFSNIQFPIYLLLLFFPPISRISILSVQIDLGILESPPRDLETRKINNNAVEVAAIVFFGGGTVVIPCSEKF